MWASQLVQSQTTICLQGTFICPPWRPWRRSLPAPCAETSSAKPTPCPAVTASALPASARPGATRGTAKFALSAPSVRRRVAKCCATPALLMRAKDGHHWPSKPAWGVKCHYVLNTSNPTWRDRRLAPTCWWIHWGTSPSEGVQRTRRYCATTAPTRGCTSAATVCWREAMLGTKWRRWSRWRRIWRSAGELHNQCFCLLFCRSHMSDSTGHSPDAAQ